MTKYIELIDKYEIRQSDPDEYNPPSYIWTDNTGEIIRCKDCKYYDETDKFATCDLHGMYSPIGDAYDFCSCAERREDETE